MDLDLLCLAKPSAAIGALLVLLAAERRWPASRWGMGSVRHDLRNLALGLVNGLIGVALAVWVLPAGPGGGQGILGALDLAAPLSLLLGFLLLDLWMYVWHRLHHAVPLLWRVHRAHHSDLAMDASTALRFHPIETTLAALARLPLAWLLGLTATHVVLYEVILLPVILFHHSNLRVPAALDRRLRLLLVTPALHRIHHSPERSETDSNFSSVLSVWDRLFRSLRADPTAPGRGFGVPGLEAPRWQSWLGLLVVPFRAPAPRPPRGGPRLSDSRSSAA